MVSCEIFANIFLQKLFCTTCFRKNYFDGLNDFEGLCTSIYLYHTWIYFDGVFTVFILKLYSSYY